MATALEPEPTTTKTINVANVGPVSHVSIPIPEGGGVVVLSGHNGAGKSRTLEAVETALTGRGKIDVKDKELHGTVEAFGVTLKIGRNTRRTGELVVQSLEGKLSVAELVEPNLKSPDAADAKRIKALIQLSGVKAEIEQFYPLVGGKEKAKELFSAAATESTDLVEMSERVKRNLEEAARKRADLAKVADGEAKAGHEAAASIDLTGESNSARLQATLEGALKTAADIEARIRAHDAAKVKAQAAQDNIEDIESTYDGATVEQAAQYEAELRAESLAKQTMLIEAEKAFAAAKSDYTASCNLLAEATKARHAAENHEKLLASWRAALADTIPLRPSDEECAAAGIEARKARQALEQGTLIRHAMEQKRNADIAAKQAMEYRADENRLREAAKATDTILSAAVARTGSPLRVEAGRLVLDTKRGATYFADLSEGERWRIALDVAIEAVGANGVIVIPQTAWEGLDGTNRLAIAKHVEGRSVVVLTAEAAAGELRAEVFG